MIANKTFHEAVKIVFLISWLIILFCTSIILIITIRYWRRQCRSVLNLLMCNSSASLLFFAITYFIQTPYFIQQIYYNAPEPSSFYCQITGFLATFGTGVASYSCIVQAISRFFITVLYERRALLTFRTNWILIIIIWITSGIIAVGMFLSPSAYQYEPESLFCTLTTKNLSTSSIAVLFFVVFTVIILIILYGIIVHYTLRRTRINPHSASTLQARRNRKVFHKVIFSVCVHALGGIPYIICIIMNRTGEVPWPLYSIAGLSLSVTCAIHAVFLFTINDQVKKILYEMLFKKKVSISNTITSTKRNQITSYPAQMRTLQTLPTIAS